jgi:hypothetical protein
MGDGSPQIKELMLTFRLPKEERENSFSMACDEILFNRSLHKLLRPNAPIVLRQPGFFSLQAKQNDKDPMLTTTIKQGQARTYPK